MLTKNQISIINEIINKNISYDEKKKAIKWIIENKNRVHRKELMFAFGWGLTSLGFYFWNAIYHAEEGNSVCLDEEGILNFINPVKLTTKNLQF